MLSQRLHHQRADGDVGDEVAVHHVDVDPVAAGGVDRPHLVAELGEVGGEDGWRDDNVFAHVRSLCTREAPEGGQSSSYAAIVLRRDASAATAGNWRPASHSRNAPPAVDT